LHRTEVHDRRVSIPDGNWAIFVRKVLRSWALQGLGVYAITEAFARILLEGGFILALWLAGLPALPIFVAWLLFHTAAWFLLYSGFGRLWILLGVSTDVSRIRMFLEDLRGYVGRSRGVRAVYLRGSGARGELNDLSDIDIWLVPARPRALGVLLLWAVRFRSLLRRVPLEADLLDTERYVPFIAEAGATTALKEPAHGDRLAQRWAAGGILMSFSGLDGSGKTTIANGLVASLRDRGLDAVYFYGHRLTYLRGGTRRSFAIAFKSFWRHVGRSLPELDRHRLAKALFDVATILDYVIVLWRLAILQKPRRILIVDRYVADVIAYLRMLGPGRLAEPFLVGMSFVPDIPILFEITPREVLARKQEQSLHELERYAEAYSDLKDRLHLVPVDARPSEHEVRSRIEGILLGELQGGFGTGVAPVAT